jgi:hypothetical protein
MYRCLEVYQFNPALSQAIWDSRNPVQSQETNLL